VLYVEGTTYAGGKNGMSSDHVIDEIHNTLMSYIREQPGTWAPIISSVSVLKWEFYFAVVMNIWVELVLN